MENQETMAARCQLLGKYKDRVEVNSDLSRAIVSYQANKKSAESRWFKYKEGYSEALMRYLIEKEGVRGPVLDPFAGSGTTLFSASDYGMEATGIELLPPALEIIHVRKLLREADRDQMAEEILRFERKRSWELPGPVDPFPHVPITLKAFPPDTERLLGRYRWETLNNLGGSLGRLARFSALCVLENISYNRKDGQYLRWDVRSGKGTSFHKGEIMGFTQAVTEKLQEIAEDIPKISAGSGEISVRAGSCLEILPQLPAEEFGCVITSPPYCNRYDYTRTYALELAMMGVGEEGIKQLRQQMLSCTVENRPKSHLGEGRGATTMQKADQIFEAQALLQDILCHLESLRQKKSLNNSGIVRMIHHYFREMAFLIVECARVLRPGSPFVMVNDNVRYHGIEIPVDLILGDMAEQAGFKVEKIWVLAQGKGNSSQQMGEHGREALRKCVYVWRKI